jgi:hypothetical protein
MSDERVHGISVIRIAEVALCLERAELLSIAKDQNDLVGRRHTAPDTVATLAGGVQGSVGQLHLPSSFLLLVPPSSSIQLQVANSAALRATRTNVSAAISARTSTGAIGQSFESRDEPMMFPSIQRARAIPSSPAR